VVGLKIPNSMVVLLYPSESSMMEVPALLCCSWHRFYERGDLPISVDHKSFKNAIKWKVSTARAKEVIVMLV